MTRLTVVFDDPDALVDAVAARLLSTLGLRIGGHGEAHLCLTGGTIATRLYQRLGALDASDVSGLELTRFDWGRVHLWWGDERWVPSGHADRNDATARAALGSIWDRAILHPMPSSDSGLDLDRAADRYRDELGDTTFDLCLLGVGPDGHVASLFPDHPSARTPGRVIPVRDSPKPPADRISLTHEVINSSAEVWLVVAGADKADAVAAAQLAHSNLPAAQVSARQRTMWKLDRAAAAGL